MPFISFYDYITSREITQEKNEKIDKKIKHFECLHQFFYFKSVKLPKTLLNGLINSKLFDNKEEILEILDKMNLNPQIRGEKLTIEQFAELANLKLGH